MKKIYKLIICLFLAMFIKSGVKGLTYGGCDYSTIANLKKLLNNINISYSYEIKNNEAYFDITLNNIPKDVYFKDLYLNKEYHYDNTNEGEITIKGYSLINEGSYVFYTDISACKDIKLGSRYYKLPIYNSRKDSELCADIPNFYMCKRWVTKYYSQTEFETKINKYKEELNETSEFEKKIVYDKDFLSSFIEFYVKYYYYFLPIIIIGCVIIITISNKKNKFKL